MVRLTRATFFSFALMLGVFAVWALSGFGYPSAPVPITLNVVSKILAFITVLTLFPPPAPRRGDSEHRDRIGTSGAALANRPLARAWPAHRGPLLPALRPALP